MKRGCYEMMQFSSLILFASIFACNLHASSTFRNFTYSVKLSRSEGRTAREKVYQKILDDYEKDIIPLRGNDTVSVTFGLALLDAEMNGETGLLTVHAWTRMMWKDWRLSWDPAEYDSVTELRIPSEHLWIPDIRLYNQRSASVESLRAIVIHDGTVLMIPPAVYVTSPEVLGNSSIIAKYKFGSWTYNGFMMDLVLESSGEVDTTYFGGDYVIESSYSVKNVLRYPCCPEPYPDLTFTVQFAPAQT